MPSYIKSTVGDTTRNQFDAWGSQPPDQNGQNIEDSVENSTDESVEEQNTNVVEDLKQNIDKINIAEDIDQEKLNKLGELVCLEYQIDEDSRSDWRDKTEQALKFANQETQEKQYPWPKASNVVYPVITTAAMQFAARTYPAIIQNRNVVKGVVWGSDKGQPVIGPDGQPIMGPDGQPQWVEPPGAKRERADRVGGHMSYQLLEEMPEWEPQVDTLLHVIPIVGGAARKTYYDPVEDRNFSVLVSLIDLVWNFNAKTFESAPRHTEILSYYPVEIEQFERAGLFLELDVYGAGDVDERPNAENPTADSSDSDAPHIFLEQHRTYDLDEDGYPEPYIVTVHKRSGKVVRIVARYDEEGIIAKDDEVIKIIPTEHYTLIPFLPNFKGGSYPTGFGHLLRPLNEAINTSLNQMFDAGHLQNAGGGFVGTSLNIPSGPTSFQVGKYIPVNNKGMAIRDAVFPIPFPGPSSVLFQLLGTLLQASKDVASIQDIMTGDSSMANQPPTTVLALIEQGMKLYSAIHKRVYRAFKSEFQKLYRLNRKRIQKAQRYKVGDEWLEVTPDDYRLGGGVEPIADPTMVTDMQKLGRAQILLQFLNDPLINQIELRRRFLDAAMIDRIDELLITQPQMTPADQLKMQEIQVNIGRARAAELKDTTQAVLNLAQVRKLADEKEMNWIDQQLEVMKMHVEAANTMVKAADVELKSHDRVHATRVKAHTPGTQEAKGAASKVIDTHPVNDLDGALSSMPFQMRKPVGSVPTVVDGARASGGPVQAGKSYLVGEKGPEIIKMGGDGTVIPYSSDTYNLGQATKDLNLTPQEQYLYMHGIHNMNTGRGVMQGDDLSTIYNRNVEGPDGRAYNIPSVWDGKILNEADSKKRAAQSGWDKWPSYDTWQEADRRYIEDMHPYMDNDVQQFMKRNPKMYKKGN